jgi:integrase
MLTAKKVAALTAPGRYRDAQVRGLYLQVSDTGAKSWVLRFEYRGRERMAGLGSVREFSLKEARQRALTARQQLADGIDPLQAKQAERARRTAEAAKQMSFKAAAEAYYNQHSPKWSSRKHAAQFLSTLERYAFPIVGQTPIALIDLPAILRVLEQPVPAELGHPAGTFWTVRPETASRVRNRIESVLDYATVRGHRSGDNPARWKNFLDQVLPALRQLGRTERHHAAMPFAQVPSFVAELRAQKDNVIAKALLFTILTAARTAETVGAQWSEIDLDQAVWVIPASRMKGRREHRQPLAPEVIELLKSLPVESNNDFVFIGSRPGAGLNDTTMSAAFKRMGRAETIHGLRSSFRVWAAERTGYAREVAEQALAHTIGNAVERAYARTDLFDQRRRLMEQWARYCCEASAAGEVVSMMRARP